MKKSQASLDFILTFGIGFVLILVLAGIFISYSGSAKQSLDKQQIEKIGSEIIRNSERIYFLGDGNRLTVESLFPNDIENFTLHHSRNENGSRFDYLNVSYQLDGQIIFSVFTTSELYIGLNCTNCHNGLNVSYYNQSDFAGGSKKIRIESKGDFVSIDFFKG